MKVEDILYKRVLVSETSSGYHSKTTIEEIKILEVSPSGNWTKIQNMYGSKFWKNSGDIKVVELLQDQINLK